MDHIEDFKSRAYHSWVSISIGRDIEGAAGVLRKHGLGSIAMGPEDQE